MNSILAVTTTDRRFKQSLKRLLRFHDWSPDIKSLITNFFP